MNKSKKAIKGSAKVKKAGFKVNLKVWIILSAVLGLVLIGAILFDQLYKRPILTIDDDKYYLEDLTYYFYTVESTYDYINQLYGGAYWDMPSDELGTTTVREAAKEEAINNIIYNEVLYKEAVANGYTLSDEDIEKINTDIASLLYEQGLSEEFLEHNNFTPEYLKDILTRTSLASNYREDVISKLGIDEEKIKSDFKYEDYRQYDIEYLFISTETQDDEGKNVPMNEKEKKAAFDIINAKRDAALETEDWSTLIPENEKELQYNTDNFLADDESYSEEFKEMMMAMENNSVSEVYEAENGYYVIRMKNNNSTESYDNAVEDAITTAENEAFTKEYNENIFPKHTFKINAGAVSNLRMGRITLVY